MGETGGLSMRKKIVNQHRRDALSNDQNWLDLERLAEVELTSEEAQHPIEAALTSEGSRGWRAAHSGAQTIRVVFDAPQRIRRIQLIFGEDQQPRTQEFVLGWSSDAGGSYRELVRQQFNFSPPATTEEFEDYTFDLPNVKELELKITPDISGGEARASVEQFRVG